MADGMLLPLRSTTIAQSTPSLELRVRQIESQKGSFRNVTEMSLLEDIDKGGPGAMEVASDDEDSEEDDETPESKQRKLWQVREEMMKQLLRAQNETLTALDSISLLLSGTSKGPAAKTSMSPALASVVPAATLGAQKIRNQGSSSTMIQQRESLYLGYKLDGMNKAIEKIESSRKRLDEHAKQESMFWKQVADLSAQDLIVSRLPGDSKTIGVHFGFPEAAPKFRNRGFAVLRTNQEGQLRVDQTVAGAKRHSINVKLLRGGKVTGRSKARTVSTTSSSLAATIGDLRRNLFEEELFFEIGREARAIANQGVTIVGKIIAAEIVGDLKMYVELAEYEEESEVGELADDDTANGIVLCLRGLLSKGHEQSLARRSQPPAPLVPKAPPISEYALLRPLLSHMRQQTLVSKLEAYCVALKSTMTMAGLAFDTRVTSVMNTEVSDIAKSHDELLLDTLLDPADTTFNISLPTAREYEVKIRTHLAPPAFGTVFTVSQIESKSTSFTPPKMSNIDAVKAAIRNAVAVDVIELATTVSDPAGQQWTADRDGSGMLKSDDASILLDLRGTALRLRFHKSGRAASRAEEAVWVWDADQMSTAPAGIREKYESQHLTEIVQELLKEAT